MGPKKNWSDDDDLTLLRQVSADTPFTAGHGRVMDAWDRVASTISSIHGFTRAKLDGKKAQNRFMSLLDKHSNDEKTSARASGVSEAYGEKRELLDNLASLVADHKQEEAVKTEAGKKKKEDDIAAGARARDAAMQSLGKRKKDKGSERPSPEKKTKIDAMIEAFSKEAKQDMEYKQQELELRRLELEERRMEREDAKKDREADRKERLRAAELEKEKMLALMDALVRSTKRQNDVV